MAQIRFCSRCGSSVAEGDERCRLCRTSLADMTVATATATVSSTHADSDTSPFVTIWLHPRNTIRGILDTDASYLVVPLAAAGGALEALSRASEKNAGDVLSLPVILAIALIGGPLGGVLGLYLGGWLLHVTGRWIGGTATKPEIRASIVWGTVPTLWGGLLWIPLLALAGSAMFMSDLEATGLGASTILLVTAIIFVQLGTYLWSIFTALHSLGEAQGFSAWRALGNSVLAGLVVLVPIIGLVLLAVLIPALMRG
jgi:hypothetical protein